MRFIVFPRNGYQPKLGLSDVNWRFTSEARRGDTFPLAVKPEGKEAIMKKGLTELVFIVDRSGSMGGLESDTIGGINATLARNREAEGEAIVSIVLFDNVADVLVDRQPLAEVPDLTRDDYQVRGCTALLDAVGDSVKHIARVQGYMPDDHKAEHVIFVITTDGLENASTRWSYDDVRRVIEQRTEEGWEFVFLGANIDAVGEAARIGIAEDRAATYIADAEGSATMFEGVADACTGMRALGAGMRLGGLWKKGIERDTARRG